MTEVEQLKKKYDEERGIIITYDQKGRAFVSFPVSGVPLPQFEEWNLVCEDQFNSSRWQKIYLDHRMNETVQTLTSPGVQHEVEQKEETKKESTLLSGEKLDD